MSKTERFNVVVQVEKKAYQPGSPVPIGTKDGISREEADNIRANFGDWTGGIDVAPSGAPSTADIDDLRTRLDAVTKERDALAAEKDRLTAENARLDGEATQLTNDNSTLAEHVASLQGQVEKLTAPK